MNEQIKKNRLDMIT